MAAHDARTTINPRDPAQDAIPDHDTPPSRPKRLLSLDALRGLAIACIIGGDGIAWSLGGMAGDRTGLAADIGRWLSRQLTHSQWEGLRFYDLVFPLFIFATGVAIAISLDTLRQRGDVATAVRRVAIRSLILFALGVIYYGGLSTPWPEVRLMGVLQRIALCYFFASLLFLSLDTRGLGLTLAGILVGYWALLTFIPVSGPGSGPYSESGNLAMWVDEMLLPGKRWNGTWDPEGLLSTVPAIGSCLMGVLAGKTLIDGATGARDKSLRLASAGVAALLLGCAWSLQFPIIKAIWTSSYVLVTGGWSLILLAAAHHVIDVWGVRRWSLPLVWIGANAITIYLVHNFVNFERVATRLVGGDVAVLADRLVVPGTGQLLAHVVGLLLAVALARYLYVNRIFIRV